MHLRRFLTATRAHARAREQTGRGNVNARFPRRDKRSLRIINSLGIKSADAPLINSGRSSVLSSASRGADRPGSQQECDKREKLPTLVMHHAAREFMAGEATLSIRAASLAGDWAAAVCPPVSSFDLRKDTVFAGYRHHQGDIRVRATPPPRVSTMGRDHRRAPLIHFTKQFR